MGHLINPISFRLYKSRYWNNIWNISHNNINYSYINLSDYLINFLILKFFQDFLISFKHGIIFLNTRVIRKYNTIIYNIYIHDSFFDIMCFKFFKDLKTDWKNNKYKKIKSIMLDRIKLKRKFKIRKLDENLKSMSYYFNNFFKDRNYLKISKKNYFLTLYNQLSLSTYFNYAIKRTDINISEKQKYKVFFKLFWSFITTKIIKLFWLKIKLFLDKLFCYFFNNNKNYQKHNYLYNICSVSRYWMWTQLVSDFIVIRLSQNFRLGEILSTINRFFHRLYRVYKIIKGYKIQCTGRFSRKQRAAMQWKLFHSIKPSTLKSRLTYSISDVILKYGKCSIKVWIRITRKSKKRIRYKF